MNKEIILIGGFHEVIELCEESGYTIVGIIDDNLQNSYLGYTILGTDNDAKSISEKYKNVPLVVSPDSPVLRQKLFKMYSAIGFRFESIVSPSAKVSKNAIIGKGCVIQHDVNVSAFTHIGNFTKLNTKCNVMHDCHIGEFVTIAPNAVILGRVNIERSSYIGANSTILPGLTIEMNSIIGAGAVVTKNVAPGIIVKGVPAK